MRSILFLFFLLIVLSAKSQISQNWKNGYYYSSSGEKISGVINYKAYNNAFKFRSATGEEVSDPSLLQTVEGGLKVVEKEIVKGAVETVAAVEAHPKLIAE